MALQALAAGALPRYHSIGWRCRPLRQARASTTGLLVSTALVGRYTALVEQYTGLLEQRALAAGARRHEPNPNPNPYLSPNPSPYLSPSPGPNSYH
eukprot:scaffold132531_cov39-Phaeocystis_antarctica.AAC.1